MTCLKLKIKSLEIVLQICISVNASWESSFTTIGQDE